MPLNAAATNTAISDDQKHGSAQAERNECGFAADHRTKPGCSFDSRAVRVCLIVGISQCTLVVLVLTLMGLTGPIGAVAHPLSRSPGYVDSRP